MQRAPWLVLGLAVLLHTAPTAQQPSPPIRLADQPIFRLNVSLVQLDAVVTDKQGRHVITLGRDDFEVYQDGRPQPVTAVSYIETDDGWVDTSGLPPLPIEALKPEDARRVVAVVVDDLRMSDYSLFRVRLGLSAFFDRLFQPGDLGMMVTTTGAQVGRLTYNAKTLKASAMRLRFSSWGAEQPRAVAYVGEQPDPLGSSGRLLERVLAEGAVQRILEVFEAVTHLPGRKSVVLVSEGFGLNGPTAENAWSRELLQRVIDGSNRAGVVIYTLDPRGVVAPDLGSSGKATSRSKTLSGRWVKIGRAR